MTGETDGVLGNGQGMAPTGAAAGSGAALRVALGTRVTGRHLPSHRALRDGRSQENEVPLRRSKKGPGRLHCRYLLTLRSCCISECFLALFVPCLPCTSHSRLLGWCWFVFIACPL